MLSYEKLLLYYAIPYFTLSVVVELVYARFKGRDIRLVDSVASLSSGMTNILKVTLGLSVSIISYKFLLSHFALFHWDKSFAWMYLLCFIYIDFTGYWQHRIQHVVNFFWNHHIIHHSSEEYNLACALRQSISEIVSYFTIFLLPLSLLGVPIVVVGIVAPIHLFLQFWYHTRFINRLGVLEKVLVTPSHHRVHHAMNDIYMDKNFSQVFIIWDKIFGTYQEELHEVEAVYGVKRPVQSWNPFLINFKHMALMITDAWRTRSIKDKLRIWFMPTGWRPADVMEQYPVAYVKDVNTLEKYDPSYSKGFLAWSLFQMLFSLALVCFMFYQSDLLDKTTKLIFGSFIMVHIFAYTAVMDKKWYGVALSIIESAFAIGWIMKSGDWFGLSAYWQFGPIALAAALIVSAAATILFQLTEFGHTDDANHLGALNS